MGIIEEMKREFQRELAALNEHYGDDYDDWPLDNRDPDVVAKRGEYRGRYEVYVRGVRVGWVSKVGGRDGAPPDWHAYFRRPGKVKGKALPNDPSKLRYAIADLVYEAHKEAARAARYELDGMVAP